jgi:hypothetical protein
MLLDLSAAFHIVDHAVLLQRLRVLNALNGTVISLFAYYLGGRTQCIRSSTSSSLPSALLYGVPQRMVLGHFSSSSTLQIVKRHQLHPHTYADETQIYRFCSPSAVSALVDRVSACFDDVFVWIKSNRLQLSPLQTDVLWFSSIRRQYQIPT